MKLHYFLFDLDGTLVDSSGAILASLRLMEGRLGLPPLPEEDLRKFLGPPLKESLSRYYGASRWSVDTMVEAYVASYMESGIDRTVVFDGVQEALRHIRAKGGRIALATLKEHHLAVEVLRRTGLEEWFDYVALDLEGPGDKAALIAECLEHLGCGDRSQAVMFGDSPYDGRAAALTGTRFVPMTDSEGFRAPGSLEGLDCLFIARDPGAMRDFILSAI